MQARGQAQVLLLGYIHLVFQDTLSHEALTEEAGRGQQWAMGSSPCASLVLDCKRRPPHPVFCKGPGDQICFHAYLASTFLLSFLPSLGSKLLPTVSQFPCSLKSSLGLSDVSWRSWESWWVVMLGLRAKPVLLALVCRPPLPRFGHQDCPAGSTHQQTGHREEARLPERHRERVLLAHACVPSPSVRRKVKGSVRLIDRKSYLG